MRKNYTFNLILSLTFLSFIAQAQAPKCASDLILKRRIEKDPTVLARMNQVEKQTQEWVLAHAKSNQEQAIITIPVVVHVLYNTNAENISVTQIQSQIQALNEDFRLLNADSLQPNHPFWPYTADVGIEFCLASKDPNGNATSGITRTFTDSTFFGEYDTPKYNSTGGKDNWDPTKYLNVWVCNLNGTLLGHATFPSDLASDPDLDGVVCRHQAFGYTGTAGTGGFTENAEGRTMTHEIGHWLNLRHIWGDNQPNCGDDLVSDTPPLDHDNGGCPSFPFHANNACGTDEDGEMFMNYMDYVDDNCMVMFTSGQASRMKATLDGARSALKTSNGCGQIATGLNEFTNENSFAIFPNPSNGDVTLHFKNNVQTNVTISILNIVGDDH